MTPSGTPYPWFAASITRLFISRCSVLLTYSSTVYLDDKHPWTVSGPSSSRFLDTYATSYLGGFPAISVNPAQLSSDPVFSGCIRNAWLNSNSLSLASAANSFNVVNNGTCERSPLCFNGSCLNGGSCSYSFDRGICLCPIDFSGATCQIG